MPISKCLFICAATRLTNFPFLVMLINFKYLLFVVSCMVWCCCCLVFNFCFFFSSACCLLDVFARFHICCVWIFPFSVKCEWCQAVWYIYKNFASPRVFSFSLFFFFFFVSSRIFRFCCRRQLFFWLSPFCLYSAVLCKQTHVSLEHPTTLSESLWNNTNIENHIEYITNKANIEMKKKNKANNRIEIVLICLHNE